MNKCYNFSFVSAGCKREQGGGLKVFGFVPGLHLSSLVNLA
jgi:hypothetical protein